MKILLPKRSVVLIIFFLTHQASEEDHKGNEFSCDISSSEPYRISNTNMIYVLLGHIGFYVLFNTLRTGDADLRFYIATVQDG